MICQKTIILHEIYLSMNYHRTKKTCIYTVNLEICDLCGNIPKKNLPLQCYVLKLD